MVYCILATGPYTNTTMGGTCTLYIRHIHIYTNDYDTNNINTKTITTNDNNSTDPHRHPHTTNDQHYDVVSIMTPKSQTIASTAMQS